MADEMTTTASCLGGTKTPKSVPVLEVKIDKLYEAAANLLAHIRAITDRLNIPPWPICEEGKDNMVNPSIIM